MLNNSTTVDSSSTIGATQLLFGKLFKTSFLTKNQLTTSILRERINLKEWKNSMNFL